MFCIECGQELPATAKFCSNCGTRVISAKTPTQPQPILDDIASKAVDIVVMDETPSFNDGGYTDDDVRKKAAFFGEGGVPEPQPTISVRTISTASTPPRPTIITKPKPQKSGSAKTKKYGKYSYVGEFYNGIARVRLNGKEGFINDRGDEVIPLIYDSVWTFYNGLSKVKLGNKWGFIDRKGKEIIPVKYNEIKTWQDGIAEVSLNGKWGFVNKKGKEVISVIYDSIQSFNDKLFKVELNGKWGIINHAGGEIIPCKYDDIRNDKDDKIIVGLKGLYGIKTIEGNELIPAIFNEIISYENYTATGVIKGKKVYATKAGVIYDKVVEKHQYRIIVSYNNKHGVLNSAGGIVIPLVYDYARFDHYKYIVVKQDDKYGVFNESGKLIIPIKYTAISCHDDYVKVCKDCCWGVINVDGQEIIPPIYELINGFFVDYAIAIVRLNKKYGLIDRLGREITPIKYDLIESFVKGKAKFLLDGRWGVVDNTGKEIVPAIYDMIYDFFSQHDICVIQLNKKYGMIDKHGKEIISFDYDNMEFNPNWIKVRLGEMYGIIGWNGDKLLSAEYDEIKNISYWLSENRFYSVKKRGKYGIIEYDNYAKCIIKRVDCCLDSIGEFDTTAHIINAKIEAVNSSNVRMAKIMHLNKVYYIDEFLNIYEKAPWYKSFDYIPSNMTWWKSK